MIILLRRFFLFDFSWCFLFLLWSWFLGFWRLHSVLSIIWLQIWLVCVFAFYPQLLRFLLCLFIHLLFWSLSMLFVFSLFVFDGYLRMIGLLGFPLMLLGLWFIIFCWVVFPFIFHRWLVRFWEIWVFVLNFLWFLFWVVTYFLVVLGGLVWDFFCFFMVLRFIFCLKILILVDGFWVNSINLILICDGLNFISYFLRFK